MLDVHPPHHSPNTWRDFFIHIATIVIGLLIAIGLEQTVEWLAHRHERSELIENMHVQAERNLPILQEDMHGVEIHLDWLHSAIEQLQDAPLKDGVVTITLPAHLATTPAREPSRAVWSVAKSNGTAALLPENLSEVYDRLEYDAENCDEAVKQQVPVYARESAAELRFRVRFDPGATLRLTEAQRNEVISLLSDEAASLRNILVAIKKWAASTDAVLHNVQSRAEMNAYLGRIDELQHTK
jgi:hypothetical protein